MQEPDTVALAVQQKFALRVKPGGPRMVLAAIHDPKSIRKVLGAPGLSSEVPGFWPARSPPRQGELEFGGQAAGEGSAD